MDERVDVGDEGSVPQTASSEEAGPPTGGGGISRASVLGRLTRSPLGVLGAVLVVGLVAVAVFASVIAPYDFAEFNPEARLQGPSFQHWLGTDHFGRDVLSRVIYGARISLFVGLAAAAISFFIGVTIGVIAGYRGGWVDEVIMRFVDLMMSFPQIVIAIAVAAILGPSLRNVIFIVGVLGIPHFARVARGTVLLVSAQEYVTVARTMGLSPTAVMWRHVLPNSLGPLIVYLSLIIPGAIMSETALSFLGLGIDPTGVPSWGSLLSAGRDYITQAWWIATFPGIAITFAVLGFNLLGDAARDAMDTKLAQ